MKNVFFLFVIVFLLIFHNKGNAYMPNDTTKEEIKTGWTFGALPVISYDTDRGLKYGGLVNFYNYGDGETYPQYLQSIYLEISRTTKGSGINQLLFDSEHIIPDNPVRFTVDLSYFTENSLDFYGFNGYEADYNPRFSDKDDDQYISRMFYRYQRKLFHFSLHIQDDIGDSDFRWLAGIEQFNHKLSSFDFDNYNQGLDDEDKLKDTATLYDLYNEWGFIDDEDVDGGVVNYIKSGLVYDSRDQEANPMKGMWSEILFAGAPGFLGNKENTYLKMSLIHRHYFTIIPKDLNLAVRLGYQGTILGESPFYMQSYLLSSFTQSVNVEGLGGSKSLRGILRNRILGDDIGYGNFELRWKFLRTKLFKQNLYIALSTFFDTGKVLDPIDIDRDDLPQDVDENKYFDQRDDSFHSSLGAGLHFAMNKNFVVAVDYGVPFDSRDGNQGFYIGMNFLY
jgi:outer membrane protein assembly factor BamA